MRVRWKASFDNMLREMFSRTEPWIKRRNQWWNSWEKTVLRRRNSPGKGLEMLLSLTWLRAAEEEMAAHSSIPVWEIPWTDGPGGLLSMESQKSQTRLSDWTTAKQMAAVTKGGNEAGAWKANGGGTSLVAPWVRIRLPGRGSRVPSLVGELRSHKPNHTVWPKKRKERIPNLLPGSCLGFLHVQVQCVDVVYNHTMPSVYVHDVHGKSSIAEKGWNAQGLISSVWSSWETASAILKIIIRQLCES